MSAQEPEIRNGTTSDLDVVMSIERAAHAEPWARALFSQESSRDQSRVLLVSPGPGKAPVSCLSFWIRHDEAHIVNLATHPDYRRRGFATLLLEHLVSCVISEDVRYIMLEVRRSNVGAIALYTGAGFRLLGARPLYYVDGEDALIMVLRIDSQCGSSFDRTA